MILQPGNADSRRMTMTELAGKVGFASSIDEKALAKRRRIGVELFATLALAGSLLVAATAVSIGVARAQALHAVIIRL
jgi:hypothetical protein